MALWTPSEITTTAWYDANDASTITESSGNVSQWDDKSGNDYHLVQSTGSAQPETDLRTIGGLNTIDFNGSTDWMEITSGYQPGSNDSIVLAVLNVDYKEGRVVNNQVGTGTRHGLAVDIHVYDTAYNHGASYDPAITTNSTGIQLLGGYRDSSTLAVGRNGTYSTGGTAGTVGTIDDWYVGAYDAGDKDFYNGAIGELVVVLDYSLTDRQLIEGYLAWKWDGGSAGTLVGNLPVGHPYKSAAPTTTSISIFMHHYTKNNG